MKIPADAIIAREKLTRYLLVFQEENDKSQFLAQAGYTPDNPDDLELAIRRLIMTADARYDRSDQFGDYYRADGELFGVNDRALQVITIWIVRLHEDEQFRFVTLKPWRKPK